MPDIVKFGFSGGVFSEKLSMRSDLKKFDLGLSEGHNFFIEYTGGASTRPGTEFIDYIADQGEPCRLVAFSFNRNIANTYGVLFSKDIIRFVQDGAYVLEAAQAIASATSTTITITAHGYSDGDWVKLDGVTYEVSSATTDTFQISPIYGSLYDPSGSVGKDVQRIYTIASPYAPADLRYLTFSQYRDELYIASTDYPLKKLIRSSATNWALSDVTLDANNNPPTNLVLTPSATGNFGVVFAVTSVDANGRESYIDGTGIELTRNTINWSTTAGYMALSWTAPVGVQVDHYRVYRSLIVANSQVNYGMQLGFVGKAFFTKFNDPNIVPDFSQTPPRIDIPVVGGQVPLATITAAGTGATDSTEVTAAGGTDFTAKAIVESGAVVGIRILNPGYGYSGAPLSLSFSAGTATAEATPTGLSGNNPATTAMVQQRRIRAGTINYPGTLFGSRVGEPDNFYSSGLGLATDPYALTLDSEQLTPIRFILPYPEGMFVFQDTGVTQVRGLDDGVIQPGSAKAQELTEDGCARLQPIQIKRDYLYLNSAQTSVYALGPTNLPQYYVPTDITVFSEHYFRQSNPITYWTWAKAPHKLLWAVRADGTFLSLTYVSEQEVTAWSDHATRGFVECVESVLENEIDRPYMIVRRTIGGVERRYLERMALREDQTPDDAWAVDCGLRTTLTYPAAGVYLDDADPAAVVVTATAGVFTVADIGKIFRIGLGRAIVTGYTDSTHITIAFDRREDYDYGEFGLLAERLWPEGSWSIDPVFSTMSGLDHLEGQTVEVLGDGNELSTRVVSSGSITLSTPSSYVVAGLGYSGRLRTLPITASDAAVEGRYKRVADLAVRLYRSRGLKFGDGSGDQLFPLPFRQGDPATTAPTFRKGMYEVSIAAEMTLDGEILVTKSGPLHATVLGYVSNVEIGN